MDRATYWPEQISAVLVYCATHNHSCHKCGPVVVRIHAPYFTLLSKLSEELTYLYDTFIVLHTITAVWSLDLWSEYMHRTSFYSQRCLKCWPIYNIHLSYYTLSQLSERLTCCGLNTCIVLNCHRTSLYSQSCQSVDRLPSNALIMLLTDSHASVWSVAHSRSDLI